MEAGAGGPELQALAAVYGPSWVARGKLLRTDSRHHSSALGALIKKAAIYFRALRSEARIRERERERERARERKRERERERERNRERERERENVPGKELISLNEWS